MPNELIFRPGDCRAFNQVGEIADGMNSAHLPNAAQNVKLHKPDYRA